MEGKIYVIANFYFEDNGSLYNNEEIIERWNKTVNEDDSVFILGSFGGNTRTENRQVLERLNGKKYMCNYHNNRRFTKDEWRNWGIYVVWDINLRRTLKDTSYYFSMNGDGSNVTSFFKSNQTIYSIVWNNQEEVFKNKTLSIDAKYWDYTPILLDEIPNIISRMEEFENMEDN